MRIISGLEKHRYVAIISAFLITITLISSMAGCDGDGGNLPPSENLEITTWYDLDAIRDNLTGNHTLMNNLDSTTPGYQELASPTANGGKGWDPIGFYTPQGPTAYVGFKGTFDGQGYEIRDLYINRPDEVAIGLFRELGYGGVISDTGATSVAVTGGTLGVGGLVAVNDGTISNCHCTGLVTGDEYVGGLVGLTIGGSTVEHSYFTGSVTGNLQVGGLAGRNTGTVSNCHSIGNVTGIDTVGGLVGYAFFGSLSNSYSTGSVTGETCIGGLVGLSDTIAPTVETNHVNNSYSSCSVSGNTYVGGLIGSNGEGSTVRNCYSTGNVTGISWVGGLVGDNRCTEMSIGIVADSFWDTETSGLTHSDGGTGKNTTEMQDIATFSDAGWNIISVALNETNPVYIWNIVNNITYPFLGWQS